MFPKGGAHLAARGDDAPQHIAMAANIFGGAVDHNIDTVRKGTKEDRRGEGIVDQQKRIVGMAQCSQPRDVDHF